MTAAMPWPRAWAAAAQEFWATQDPATHFATSAGAAAPEAVTVIAEVMIDLVAEVDARLGHPDVVHVVDVGAGQGALLHAMAGTPGLPGRVRLLGIDLRDRPVGLDLRVDWLRGSAPQCLAAAFPRGLDGLVMAHEWLDEIPCVVAEAGPTQVREVLVDPATGREAAGTPVTETDDLAWLAQWWPGSAGRVEIGRSRDAAWCALAAVVREGTLLAVDYAHDAPDRAAGVWAAGTLAGYRHGRQVAAVPDGMVNVTCHVALDACAAALERTGRVRRTVRMTQRDCLRDVDPGGLARSAAVRTLRDPAGPGAFTWLRQDVVPASTLRR